MRGARHSYSLHKTIAPLQNAMSTRNEKKPSYESETLLYTPEKSTLKGTLLHWPVMAQWLKLTEGDEQTARNFRYCALKHAEIRLFKPARDAKLVSQEINFWTWKGPSQGTDVESKMAKETEKKNDAERVATLMSFGFTREDAEAQVAKLRKEELARMNATPATPGK